MLSAVKTGPHNESKSSSPFASLGLAPALQSAIAGLGFEEPTPIQSQCLPALLSGRDLVGQSRTGSGKTAAFGLPLLQDVALDSRSPQALVLCPTRELAAQVARELRRFGSTLPGLRVVELVGGQPARPQRETLERGAHVLVGTPGRVADHLKSGALDTRGIGYLVLDEADRMLDMGFGPDVKRIVAALPRERQTALFSATFPEAIEAMSQSIQRRDALRITVEEPETSGVVGIRHMRLTATPEERFRSLCRVLVEFPHESAIVFCNFKKAVAEVTERLRYAGVSADRLDGDLDQFHRDQVLARFRNGSLRVLVATDVAGRGIDIEGLDLVVNYELPNQPEIYVHRAGRTGRAGREGLAVSLDGGLRDAKIEAIEALTGTVVEVVRLAAEGTTDDLLARLAGPAPMSTILISGGRKDKVRRGDILGALTGDAGGLAGADVGKIEVSERLSYVAVKESVGRAATERLNAGRIKGKRYRATLVR